MTSSPLKTFPAWRQWLPRVLPLAVVLVLLGLGAVVYRDLVGRAHALKSLNNCREITLACVSFADEHAGVFPDTANAAQMEKHAHPPRRPELLPRDTSSAQFQLLINAGMMSSESIFFVPNEHNSQGLLRPSDDKLDEDADLNSDTNGYAYWRGLSRTSPADMPLVFTRSRVSGRWPAAGHMEEEGGVWNGRILIGRVDGSAAMVTLREEQGAAQVRGEGDRDAFDPATWSAPPAATIVQP